MEIIPVYFPMTYLSPAAEGLLSSCFGRTAVYRPSDRPLPPTMQAAGEAERIVVRTPVEAGSDRLAELMAAYHAWAEENRGVDLAALKGRQSGIPFFEESSPSRIRQDIRRMGSKSRETETVDPLFEARLFLEMAQALDCQNSDLEQSLDDVRLKETSMLAGLLGDADGHPDIGAAPMAGGFDDPGAYMTGTRLQAWWRLARSGSGPGHLLVTDSRAVMAYLVEKQADLEKIDQFRFPHRQAGDPAPAAWQERLLDHLERLVAGEDARHVPAEIPAAGSEEAAVSLSLYRFQKAGTAAFFNSLGKLAAAQPASGTNKNLLICLVEK